ncbi:MAG: SCO family protein [Actinobacteria bacterium]|nr:SCO family protein [Actinomycetota bacterium]
MKLTGDHRSQAAAFAAILVVLLAVAVAGCGGSSGGTGAPARESAPNYGTLIDQPVPAALDKLPMTNQHGETVTLGGFRGKTVMLVPFLTLCADICPFTTGILGQVERSLKADHAASKVEIVELSVDPHRDTVARLAAYARLTHAGWQLVRTSPADLAKLQEFFKFTYIKVPAGDPPSIDWMTGKPLTYDIDHSDNYFVIDPHGRERIVEDAAPDYTGKLNPKLQRFLSAEGRKHQKHPPQPDWTTADALAALGHVMRRELPTAAGP